MHGVTYPTIDSNLTPSSPQYKVISNVNTAQTTYDKLTLQVDGEPFFYNGVQLRVDKLQDIWSFSDDQCKALFETAADLGFTVLNSQIRWIDIQPNLIYNASNSTYIRGGDYDTTNYGSSSSSLLSYKSGDESNKALTYLKFNFTSMDYEIDAAKIRIYIDTRSSSYFQVNVFGLTDHDWDSTNITWASGAPNHDGFDITGTNNTDYFQSVSPSFDKLRDVAYYDIDVTDYIKDHSPDQIASFVIAPQESADVTNAAWIDGALGTHPPQLFLSSVDYYDWGRLDKLLSWALEYNIKFEIVWFGSDSTGISTDTRVPYYPFLNNKVSQVNDDGSISVVFSKRTDNSTGLYWYLLDKNDLTTRAQEKQAIKTMMNHIASWDDDNGNTHVVVGVDVSNENGVEKFHGGSITVWQNPPPGGRWTTLTRWTTLSIEQCGNSASTSQMVSRSQSTPFGLGRTTSSPVTPRVSSIMSS